MKVITLNNQKGGVAKTTLAMHMAQYEAMHGQRVMIIDTDPQAHTTTRLGHQKKPGIYDLMVRDAEWNEVTQLVSPEQYMHPDQKEVTGTLYLLPSNIETRNIANSIDNIATLHNRLNELRDENAVDLVIIDTGPTPSLLNASIYFATDGMIFPTTLTSMAFDGLIESVRHKMRMSVRREEVGKLPMIQFLGIAPTMYKSRTIEESDSYAEVVKAYGDKVLPTLNNRIIWEEAESRQCPIWQLNPHSKAMKEFTRLMGTLKGAITRA
ncbi:MAG: ParA family protein [Chloroflexota bacterium]